MCHVGIVARTATPLCIVTILRIAPIPRCHSFMEFFSVPWLSRIALLLHQFMKLVLLHLSWIKEVPFIPFPTDPQRKALSYSKDFNGQTLLLVHLYKFLQHNATVFRLLFFFVFKGFACQKLWFGPSCCSTF